MGEVITAIEQVTPEWLTTVFDRADLLGGGQVQAIQQDTSRPFSALVSHLSVTYSGDVSNRAPRRLFLKLANPEIQRKWSGRGKREVQFYRAIPSDDYLKLPLTRCYDAQSSKEGFHLLLDDLTETHIVLRHPLPPSRAQCEQVVDTLAQLHAYWWNSPQLGVNMGLSAEQKTVFNGDEVFYPAFADSLGEALWDERRAIFERALEAAPRLHERLRQGNLTLIHGDAHAWNFLYPREGASRSAVLIDWEAWDADVGIFDLAYLITLFWFPAHRARLEQKLVRRYHSVLQAHGIKHYSFDDCWNDYRHSVIRLLVRPVWWWHARPEDEFWPEVWWPRLERVICAYEDLHCEELLS
jgi:thiamine kinase-like enzyme